jgi:large subunit ribosomal protein L9
MKVILKQTVPKVGKEGQVVTVADGFARNFLFPRGLAILADKVQVASMERRQARLAEKGAATKSGAEQNRDKLDGGTVHIQGKVGKDTGRLFGAITAQDVADAIKDQLGFEVDKRKVALVQPIKRLGTFPVSIDLHQEVDATINVEVFDPEAPVIVEKTEEPAPEEEETEEQVPVEA